MSIWMAVSISVIGAILVGLGVYFSHQGIASKHLPFSGYTFCFFLVYFVSEALGLLRLALLTHLSTYDSPLTRVFLYVDRATSLLRPLALAGLVYACYLAWRGNQLSA